MQLIKVGEYFQAKNSTTRNRIIVDRMKIGGFKVSYYGPVINEIKKAEFTMKFHLSTEGGNRTHTSEDTGF